VSDACREIFDWRFTETPYNWDTLTPAGSAEDAVLGAVSVSL
jgi:hypothetical protein